MGRFRMVNMGDPLSLESEICKLLNESDDVLDVAFSTDAAAPVTDGLLVLTRAEVIAAGQVRATQALTLSVTRMTLVLEAFISRSELVDDADDYVSLESDLERLPPEKTASGESTRG